MRREVEAALAASGEFQIVYRIVRADGPVRWVDERGWWVPGGDDPRRLLEGIVMDVTDQVTREERLRRVGHAATETGRAETSASAGKGDEMLEAAPVAANASAAVLEQAIAQEFLDLAHYEVRQSASRLGALLELTPVRRDGVP